jgi:serine/threonine protein kinase
LGKDNELTNASRKRPKKKTRKLIETSILNKNEYSHSQYFRPVPVNNCKSIEIKHHESIQTSPESEKSIKHFTVDEHSKKKVLNDINFNQISQCNSKKIPESTSDDNFFEKQDKNEIRKKNPLFIKEFDLKSTLGLGGSGRTFKGIMKKTNKHLAIKYIKNKSLMFSKTPIDVFKKIALNEITIHYNVGNKFIARSLGYFSIGDDGFALLQELADKGNLKSFLLNLYSSQRKSSLTSWRKYNIVSESMVGYICFYILNAIKHLSGLDVVHLDIKAENVLVDGELDLKLTDFSVSVKLNIGLDYFKFSAHGTNCLMSPENIKRETVALNESHKADIYSLGVMIYKFIFGCYPYSIISTDKGTDIIEKFEKNALDFPCNIRISEELKDFLRRVLAKDYRERADVDQLFSHKWMKIFKSIKSLRDCYKDKEKFVIDLINDDITEISEQFSYA